MKLRYCIDTSLFINGWRKHYRPDVFPNVWNTLDELIAAGVLFSCDAVYDELQAQADDLAEWAKARREIFEKPKDDTFLEMQAVMLEFPNFAAQGGSTNAADPWLIAHARLANAVIVTDERSAERQRPTKPPKLPNVCEHLGMQWMGPVDFLAANGIVFTR